VNNLSTNLDTSVHVPVLLHEIVATFAEEARNFKFEVREAQTPNSELLNPNFWYLDGTLGGAGHALALAKEFQKITNTKLNVIGFDRDPQTIARANELLAGMTDQLILENENYRNLDTVLDTHQIPVVDFILLDLGISSDELDNSGRGFTFLKDEPLLMTMGDPATIHSLPET